ncbi:hypothetical protein T05_4084 [Trichinella murrelli]|uniref:Uncharacterized protein n=1 Tax=Trichinella murrelli TaxID=144512 RepID=A0A0V0SSV2_9BILA|nr:hypothetical protein T05_4084 [Trichinella murrelli]
MVYDCAFFAILSEIVYDAFSPPSQSTGEPFQGGLSSLNASWHR